MRNITGQAVVGDDLYGRDYELDRLWERLEQGEHILMLAPRRVGKTSLIVLRDLEADGYVKHEASRLKFRSNLLREWWRKYHGSVAS